MLKQKSQSHIQQEVCMFTQKLNSSLPEPQQNNKRLKITLFYFNQAMLMNAVLYFLYLSLYFITECTTETN